MITDAPSPPAEREVRTISRRPNPFQRLRNIWAYRELLHNFVRKELKVKYKNSILGFLWSLVNPLLYLLVFSVVFKEILRTNVPYFAIFLLSGLLAWNLFSAGVNGGTVSITGNASLVQRVWFPREILPLASIGAALVHFFLQFLVLVSALLVFQKSPDWAAVPALLLALVVLIVFAAALGIALSAINVYLRDTQHLLELAFLAWFWLSPIVYAYRTVADRLGARSSLLLLNPMVAIVTTFQRVIYNPRPEENVLPPDAGIGWYLRNLAITGAGSLVLLFVGLWLFGRLEDNLAEEI